MAVQLIMRTRLVLIGAALGVVVLLGGCVSHGSGNQSPGAIGHDSALTLDFRHKPTRAEVGFADGQNSRSYQRGSGGDLTATLILPAGALIVPSFNVNVATTAGGGADDLTVMHQPKFFDILRRFDNSATAHASLTHDAHVLGLRQAEIDAALSDVGSGAVIPQSRVLHGLVDNWLAVDVELTDSDNGQVQADYAITIDYYHNDALDKVVRDGVFAIDLTHRPSRADLAFLDSYNSALAVPSWQQTLTVKVTVPGGVIERRVASVTSVSGESPTDRDPGGTAPPRRTDVSLAATNVADARSAVLADAAALGLDPNAVRGVFDGPAGEHVKKIVPGRGTAAYDVTATLDLTPGEVGQYGAAVTYTFTYR